jgi:hypothetical protein
VTERVLQAQAGGAQHGVEALEDDGARRRRILRRIHGPDENEISHPDRVTRGAERKRHSLGHDRGAVAIARGDGVHSHQPVGAQAGDADEAGGRSALGPQSGAQHFADLGRRGVVGEQHLQEH